MSSHKNFCALTVSMIVGASCCVPSYAQHKMSLQSLFDLADRQNQRIKVSEVALKAADEGVVSAKSAMLPSVEFSLQGSYTGNAFLMSRGFSTSGTTEYIVPGLGPQQVQNGKQPTPHWGNSFTAQASLSDSLGHISLDFFDYDRIISLDFFNSYQIICLDYFFFVSLQRENS